ncbi:hypothetical protein D9613_000054 [Agrocybe pediades]|uniref:Uncharacterized protein n=1 Tax=Agrocybe pediades TaxID=84607 RepID=A0A8H4R1U7_9AGAR|nr:hypothetical protein D9613_000054 [Agrocybe pediades]
MASTLPEAGSRSLVSINRELISKRVLKHREKQRAKEAAKASKAADKPAPLDCAILRNAKPTNPCAQGIPEPSSLPTQVPLSRFLTSHIMEYSVEHIIPSGITLVNVTECLAGGIHSIRRSGSKTIYGLWALNVLSL